MEGWGGMVAVVAGVFDCDDGEDGGGAGEGFVRRKGPLDRTDQMR